MNEANYILTQDGVINKLSTYWDKLQTLTTQLENASQNMMKHLFISFLGSLVLMIVVFILKLNKDISLIVLIFGIIGVMFFTGVQIIGYLNYLDIRKKGMILYNELSHEAEKDMELHYRDEAPAEERILLGSFLLAAELPIHSFLYLTLLFLVPATHLCFLSFYYTTQL